MNRDYNKPLDFKISSEVIWLGVILITAIIMLLTIGS
jgi:hypothetical protein